MAESPNRVAFEQAMDQWEEADRRSKEMAYILSAAARGLTDPSRAVLHGIPAGEAGPGEAGPAKPVPNAQPVNVEKWPTKDELIQLITTWQSSRAQVERAWHSMPADEQRRYPRPPWLK